MAHSEQIPFLGIQTSENLSRSLDERFRAGDETAFNEVYASDLRKQILKYFLNKGYRFPDADDLTEQVMIDGWIKHETFDPNVGPLRNWLYGIAKNVHHDFMRRMGRRPEGSPFIPPKDSDVDDVLDQQPCTGRSTEERLAAEQQTTHLLRTLSAKLRDVVQLCVFDDMSDKEAAEHLGISPGTVASRKHNAFKKLRAELQQLFESVKRRG